MSWLIKGELTNDESLVMKEFNLKYPPMVKSLLDTDLYKFSMSQVYVHQWNSDHATWDFKARNVGDGLVHEKYNHEDYVEIVNQIKAYCALVFDDEDLDWLSSTFPWIHNNYTDDLSYWHPKFKHFDIKEGGASGIIISTKGVQNKISYYEIPTLEICAETYYRNHYNYDELLETFKKETMDKITKIKAGTYNMGVFSEFGARRRLSYEAQDWLIKTLKEANIPGFMGTSNVHLAKKYNLNAAGTMAHEFFELIQGHTEYNPAYSNKYALDSWIKEYGVWNGIALTDTIGVDTFLLDFQTTYATVFKGVRHDSGDPFAWGDKMIEHYKKLGIDPTTKTLLFSDSLDGEKATQLNEYFKDRAHVAFGIGTWWSAPQGIKPLNIVMKVAIVNGHDVAKLSDSPGKCMCRNDEYVDYLKRCIDWRLENNK